MQLWEVIIFNLPQTGSRNNQAGNRGGLLLLLLEPPQKKKSDALANLENKFPMNYKRILKIITEHSSHLFTKSRPQKCTKQNREFTKACLNAVTEVFC